MSNYYGSVLCLFTLPLLLVNSLHYLIARRPSPHAGRAHLTNLLLGVGFFVLSQLGGGERWNDWPLLLGLRLWAPIVFFWWGYAWAGRTLHFYYPPEFSYDRQLIDWDGRMFGQPSLWMARGRSRLLNETMNFFYFSYYFYTPVLGVALHYAGDFERFEAMALSVNLGYAICYSIYPLTPLWGPRWALVDQGHLPDDEKILSGYVVTNFMNKIMWGTTAHKGGAMPSAHSSTAIVFVIWCIRIWGLTGGLIGGSVAGVMFVATVYGRYHYVIDLIVGTTIGLFALWLADTLAALPG